MNFLKLVPHGLRGCDALLFDEGQLRVLAGSLDVPHGSLVSKLPFKPFFSRQALFNFRSGGFRFWWTFLFTSDD